MHKNLCYRSTLAPPQKGQAFGDTFKYEKNPQKTRTEKKKNEEETKDSQILSDVHLHVSTIIKPEGDMVFSFGYV